ncbi:hypothetical protein OEZ85_003964 [Tetradesmus obliquus]|uniref:Uncharacterized protein n=1 Tax=Tetradesmus obliquus TaxID=3088 RepID=A0ABY8UDJ3_TETOB|nr:hypothetical protein OEZ85_003964 [Tetradesmus obliquus]
MLSTIKQQVVDNVAERGYSKKLAVVQGELEGYACKLDGFQRALQELEMQLAEKELQVAMLKSIIRDSEDTAVLQQQLAEVGRRTQRA